MTNNPETVRSNTTRGNFAFPVEIFLYYLRKLALDRIGTLIDDRSEHSYLY